MDTILEIVLRKSLEKKILTEKELSVVKRWASKKFKISPPSNVDLIKVYHKLLKKGKIQDNKNFEKLLKKRKVRSLSGVTVVSVLTKPYLCPGKCIYCPKERDVPKSYLSGEPAVERAKKLHFSPYLQVQKRIESLKNQGHPTDKIEIRIIGGSFSVYPQKYKNWFLKNCFGAANDRTKKKIKSLEKEQKKNERAKHRLVGISIETRPDLINQSEIKKLRNLGVTMVELGVQSVTDKILEKCERGHKTKETIQATQLLKDAGFKIMYQVMQNLPGATLKNDLIDLRNIFQDQVFRPDWLKIYPCLVCKNTKLYQLWRERKYKSYSDKELINLLIKIKLDLPYWVRVARIFRDIPAPKIESGSKVSNLREVVLKKIKEQNRRCRCIRCREIRKNYDPEEKIYLIREDYNASDGKEIFLSFENKKRLKLLSFLRLRIPSQFFSDKNHFIPSLQKSAIIREIHTYGEVVPISTKEKAPQHRGLGKRLVQEAENISKKEFNILKINVISGVGVRDYWRKLGYRLQNTYMTKDLKK